MLSFDKWSKEWPTRENAGQWFVVKTKFDDKIRITFQEIRVDEEGVIYICLPCNDGIGKTSYGTRLDWYPPDVLEFSGPLKMPPNYRA